MLGREGDAADERGRRAIGLRQAARGTGADERTQVQRQLLVLLELEKAKRPDSRERFERASTTDELPRHSAGGQGGKRHDERDRKRVGNRPPLMVGEVDVGEPHEEKRRGRQRADGKAGGHLAEQGRAADFDRRSSGAGGGVRQNRQHEIGRASCRERV